MKWDIYALYNSPTEVLSCCHWCAFSIFLVISYESLIQIGSNFSYFQYYNHSILISMTLSIQSEWHFHWIVIIYRSFDYIIISYTFSQSCGYHFERDPVTWLVNWYVEVMEMASWITANVLITSSAHYPVCSINLKRRRYSIYLCIVPPDPIMVSCIRNNP